MSNVILGLLMLSPMTLYLLNKQFEHSLSLIYSASLGSIRSAVMTLLARGHVSVTESVEGGRSKKTYRATVEGEAAFLAWLTGPIGGGDLETVALSKLFFLGLLPDDSTRAAVVRDIVERARADEERLIAVEEQFDQLQIPEQFAVIARFQRLTLDYGRQSHATGIAFFRQLLDELES